MKTYKIIQKCRVCENKGLEFVYSLGNIAISDFTENPSEGVKFPLMLVYCNKCDLLQLAHNPPRHLLYKNYWYESHINPVIVKDLKEIAKEVKGKRVIDIGCNDFTLLDNVKIGIKQTGVDPFDAKIRWLDNFVNPTRIYIQDYWENVQTEKADTITAIACLYDLPDPNKFMRNIKRHLNSDGIFISQLMTLEPMIENNDLGNICHEHLEYYSYKSLVTLFERNGLEIFKVEKNSMNGGSYRIFARHYKNGSILYREKKHLIADIKSFFKRVEENKKKFENWLLKTQPKLIGYGASTKANTILQYYKIQNLGVVDVNPKKKHLYMRNNNKVIDYIPEKTEYLWVFPYSFLDSFIKKERAKGYKGKFVVIMPKFKII